MRIADVLTASRVIAAPIVIWLIFANETLAAFYLFAAAAITDLLDGYFARRSKKTASYGATFDGLADIFLLISDRSCASHKRRGVVPFCSRSDRTGSYSPCTMAYL